MDEEEQRISNIEDKFIENNEAQKKREINAKACDLRIGEISDSLKRNNIRGAWVAQLVKRPTSAQAMISQFVSSSPTLGSVLTAQSLEPASDSVSLSFSLCPSPLVLSLSLSLPKINRH